MSIAKYIRDIGRGKEGARSLTREHAYDLMSQVLDGAVTDLEIGAFALAMRIKGESVDELDGFLAATVERCLPLRIPGPRPAVVLPSYNGARKLPNLTPLLALLLAQENIPVIVHGLRHDPGRVTSAEIFEALGLSVAGKPEDIDRTLERHEPVFVPTELLSPRLARLLEVRRVVGVRNSGHTIAKLLDPCHTPALRVVNYTHPEYGHSLTEFLQRTRADALLMRGTEGEPVADARRKPRMEIFLDGRRREDLTVAPHEGVLTELPLLPREHDAVTTAVYIQSVVAGEKPAPPGLEAQMQCLLRALDRMQSEPPAAAIHEKTA